jgi:hypothetical protein
MEYEEILKKIKELSKRSDEDIENFLGYLYYESETAVSSERFEFDDLEKLLEKAESISFSLVGGDSLELISNQVIDECNLKTPQKISSLMLNVIGDESIELDEIQTLLTNIEDSVVSDSEFGMLMGMVSDDAIGERVAVALLVINGEPEVQDEF